eukprot:384283_1
MTTKRKRTDYHDTLSKNDQLIFEQYQSSHESYNSNQPWKLFQMQDYENYKQFGIQKQTCTLDGVTFTTNDIQYRKGHFLCSRTHQISLLHHLVKNKIPLPTHITKKKYITS